MNINTKKYIENHIKIRDKAGNIINFKLNEPQQKLYEIIKQQKRLKKPVRIIILKARQMGFSTLTESILFKETATKFNVNTGIIAHKEDSTTNLFNMSKRMYDNLPVELKPSKKASNAKELVFDTDDGKGLKSKIKCMTAGSDGVGRSDTFNNLHISELAFWREKKNTLTGLFQAVPNLPNTMIIIESTANGFDYFKELWDMACNGESDFIPLFVGWNELEEYKMPYTGFELTEEEKELKKIYNLSLEQLTWRRWCIANNCGGSTEDFKQEYPINPQEAFKTSGNCIFNEETIINRLAVITQPIKRGYFIYTYDDNVEDKITNIKWVDDEKGYIKIYKDVKERYPYVIGGDTAGDGSDYFIGQVLDNTTGEQIAVLRHQMDEDLYTKQMYCLGKYFNNALIGIEANFSSFPIKELERLGYDNQYVREREDTFSNKIVKAFGFKTTATTRPVIIAGLVEIAREEINKINDKETLEEMLTFVRNEKGRPEAQEGAHDDLVMALAISHYIREQQEMKAKEEEKEEVKDFFESMRPKAPSQGDYGIEIKVI